jgi:hypothetical protein
VDDLPEVNLPAAGRVSVPGAASKRLPPSSSSTRTSARPCLTSACPTSGATSQGATTRQRSPQNQQHLEAHPRLLRTLREGTSAGTTGQLSAAYGATSTVRLAHSIPRDGPPPGTAPGLRGPGRGEQAAGAQGEELVADCERSWLRQHSRPDFARRHAGRYALYRAYDVLREPRFFALEGDISNALSPP